MRFYRVSLVAAACLGSAVACAPGNPSLAAIQDSVRAVDQRFEEAFKTLDALAVAGLYAEDGMILPPGGEPQTGRIQIKDFWAAMIAAGAAGVELEPLEILGADTLAVERGSYTVLGPRGVTVDQGKYIVIWKRHNGGWQIFRDIWNTSVQPATTDTASIR